MATIVTGDLYESIDRKLTEIKRQVQQRSGYPHDPELLNRALQRLSEGDFGGVVSFGHIGNSVLTFVNEFLVEIPADFTLDACPRGAFNDWHKNITDANFPRSGLQKGKKYRAEIYRLSRNMDSQTLVEIADDRGRLMGGALGGAVLCSRYEEDLPTDRWVTCLDKKANLVQDGCFWHVPGFGRDGSGWRFGLSYGADGVLGGSYFVFFRELVSKP